jgi:hypothetical protein
MLLFTKNRIKARLNRSGLAVLIVVSLTTVALQNNAIAADVKHKISQKSFSSPEGAAAALVAAAKGDDTNALSAILGPDGKQLIFSGDKVADKNGRLRFVQLYEEKNRIVKESDVRAILEVGNDAWPFPIPIVEAGKGWRFDTKERKIEVLNRRMGRNERGAIQTCLAYVDAQREYASKDRNGDKVLEYAQKFRSEPGKRDGLYWEPKEGEEQSPMGIFVANAKREGYGNKKSGDNPSPYHGYYYKILKAQGKNAPGGAYDYVLKGRMIGGFALIAYPAQYGSSGIMTFIVSHSGEVYEKDLGKRTSSVAQAIKIFDPDKTWHKVDSKYLEPPVQDEGGEVLLQKTK